jgi:hypothetical protein
MDRFDGTAARQLDLIEDPAAPRGGRPRPARPEPSLRLLRNDIYTELARRRRRAQITARHLLERD